MTWEQLIGGKSKFDIAGASGVVLVPAGTVLGQEHIQLLRQHRVPLEDIAVEREAAPAPDGAEAAEVSLRLLNTAIRQLLHDFKTGKTVSLFDLRKETVPMAISAAGHPDMFRLFDELKANDEHFHHAAGTCVVATMIGQWIGLSEEDLSWLSLSAILHDVGKTKLPDSLLQKKGKLSVSDMQALTRHTHYGYEMLKDIPGLPHRVALVALQHHERMDGSGYPHQLTGTQIDLFGRIVAVADTFHALIARQPDREELPFHEVVHTLRAGYYEGLDPSIISVFLKRLLKGLIGRDVVLTDGRAGKVVYLNPHDDINPLVKVNTTFLDLSKHRGVHIRNITM